MKRQSLCESCDRTVCIEAHEDKSVCASWAPGPATPAPKPECRTCPLMCARENGATWCSHSVAKWGDGLNSVALSEYCEHHPLYPAWATEELQRRLAAKEEGE